MDMTESPRRDGGHPERDDIRRDDLPRDDFSRDDFPRYAAPAGRAPAEDTPAGATPADGVAAGGVAAGEFTRAGFADPGGQPPAAHTPGAHHPPPPYAPPAHPAPPVIPPTAHRRRTRRPVALLAAVAIVAAAVGGGTAYGIQELTTEASASAPAAVSPVSAGNRGTVAGVAEAVTPSTVEIKAATGAGASTGSGVILTSDGEVVTNSHVLGGADTVQVTTSDRKKYTADVIGTDSEKDLALIKLRDASGLKAATLGDSERVRVGQEVVAIGSPGGLTGTVTSGIVSALDRDVTVAAEQDQQGRQGQQGQQGQPGEWPFEFGGREFNGDTGPSTTTYKAIQTDASLNPGNSGGALIDMNGAVIGINSAMYSASSAEAGSVGLGFAIPVNTLKADLSALRAGADG
ncbi:Trypsin-like serine proteases, typically periplasmic, contain C-terminal PDZ domain [Streptomyces sp. AmelKG-E11A]|nr:Trypsin-like serine proteases, typically periplasmic, contain C-terminal PDZ domain [Streptomyces sp. AmelKG-E11A]